MKKIIQFILALSILSTTVLVNDVYAAIPNKRVLPTSEAKTALEKLTGQSVIKQASKPADRALQMARESRDQKNYVLAIKRYNYIIKNFAKTKQAEAALLDKSLIYKKMGFSKPSEYNLKKAKLISANQLNHGKIKK